MQTFGGDLGLKRYAGLELVAAELRDEQPATAHRVLELMREMEAAGLKPQPTLRLVRGGAE